MAERKRVRISAQQRAILETFETNPWARALGVAYSVAFYEAIWGPAPVRNRALSPRGGYTYRHDVQCASLSRSLARLAARGLIEYRGPKQWAITPLGRQFLERNPIPDAPRIRVIETELPPPDEETARQMEPAPSSIDRMPTERATGAF